MIRVHYTNQSIANKALAFFLFKCMDNTDLTEVTTHERNEINELHKWQIETTNTKKSL